jgi:hypothetical protein
VAAVAAGNCQCTRALWSGFINSTYCKSASHPQEQQLRAVCMRFACSAQQEVHLPASAAHTPWQQSLCTTSEQRFKSGHSTLQKDSFLYYACSVGADCFCSPACMHRRSCCKAACLMASLKASSSRLVPAQMLIQHTVVHRTYCSFWLLSRSAVASASELVFAMCSSPCFRVPGAGVTC